MRTRFNLLLTILFFISTSILSEEGANNKFHIGAEIGELGYSKLDKFGTKNYSILFGQKFSQNTWKNFGWRFSSFDVILQDSHLENIIFVKGNTADIEARQSVQRLYLDYYLPGWKKSFFEINPIISVGAGHTRVYFQSPRSSLINMYYLRENYFLYRELSLKDPLLGLLYLNSVNPDNFIYNYLGYKYLNTKESTKYSSPNLGISSRIQLLFFDVFFTEFQFDLAGQNNRNKTWVSDTFLDFPKSAIAFTWINIGLQFSF